MKYIYLRCSDLAKLTGHNKYEPLEKVVNSILSKNGIQDRYVPKTNIEDKLTNLDTDQVNALRVELHLGPTATLDEIESTIKSIVMKDSYASTITESESQSKVDAKLVDKPVLQSLSIGIKQDLRMRRGNIKENVNLNVIQSKQNIKIDKRNSQMFTKELYRCDKYVVVLRGMVDGMTEDTIIESKNRTRELFKVLRGYEQVQLESYMFLSGYKKALLTEHYNDTECCIAYDHDGEFWQGCKESIISFIDEHIAIYL
jgi:hypothetical protein